jgi:hypothetical protein
MRYEGNKTILCGCKKGSNCPTIHPTDEGYDITDDYGGKVKLTKEEFFMLSKAVKGYKKKEEV